MKVQYCYDGQMLRVIKHLIRLFSNFQIQDGIDSNGNPTLRRVPCRYGDISKQAAYSIKENSENILNSAPMMVINIDSLNMSRENVRGPIADNVVQGINATNQNGDYINQLDGYYEVERINPVPWDMEFSVNIWTTNQTNKFELFEQIVTLFAPAVPLQLSTNPLDWSSFNYVELTDYNLSSRSWPAGTSSDLDISTFKFKTMIWFTLPNKVSRAKLITEVITNLKTPGIDDMQIPDLGQWDNMFDVFTPGNHKIKLTQVQTNVYQCTLLSSTGATSINNKPIKWGSLIDYYAVHYNTLSISLSKVLEDSAPIIGDVTNIINGNCTLTLNSLPQTTFTQIDYIIDDTQDFYSVNRAGTFVNNGTSFNINGTIFDNTKLLTVDSGIFTFTDIPDGAVSFVTSKNAVYKYNKETNWTPSIKEIYEPGYWNLNFL